MSEVSLSDTSIGNMVSQYNRQSFIKDSQKLKNTVFFCVVIIV